MISGEMEDLRNNCELSREPFSNAIDNAAPASNPVIAVRNSRAIPIWLAVIALVLIALFLQTRTQITSYNFLIEGNGQTDGATVSVDGRPSGVMRTLNEGGVSTTGLRLHLSDGTHQVVVSKSGFQPQTATVVVKGEDFLGIQLKPIDRQKQN